MTLYSWSFGYMGRWPAGGLDLGLVVFLVWGCSFCMSFGLVRGCDPAFCVVWFRFRLLRRYLALWPTEVRRVYHLLEMVSEGSPGQGPAHLLSASAAEIGFRWDPVALAWSRPGLPYLAIWLALFSISRLLFLMLGVMRLLLTFAVGRVFGVGLRSVLVGSVWNGLLLGRV